jgi:hypothetical protein
MDELQYVAFLAARKATHDLRDKTLHPARPTRAVPSEQRWRPWRSRRGSIREREHKGYGA